jgi:hypothetical protein
MSGGRRYQLKAHCERRRRRGGIWKAYVERKNMAYRRVAFQADVKASEPRRRKSNIEKTRTGAMRAPLSFSHRATVKTSVANSAGMASGQRKHRVTKRKMENPPLTKHAARRKTSGGHGALMAAAWAR